MKYMGSKRRIAKDILPIILKDRKEGQYYVEPFCGGCNSLDKVANPRIANDVNPYLIALFKEMQTQFPFKPPHVGEVIYKQIQQNKESFPSWLVGYVGFNLSFAAKFFGGYRRDKVGIRNYENEAQQNLLAQQSSIQGVDFSCGNYFDLNIPDGSIIYCDPPYKGTTKYATKGFDYDKFYNWCRDMVIKGHTIFVSEYNMPDDFECVWEKDIVSSLTKDTGSKRGTEKLFKLKGENK